IVLPRPRPVVQVAENPSLKVVEGSPRASSVIVLPADTPRQKTLTPAEVSALVDMHGYSGRLLQAVREAKGVTLPEVADATRISLRYLQAIESDAHERLPSATFVRGYVKEIARMLKLDEEAVVAGYMRRLSGT
ncbi:MAG: helix-turn-helix domain-containing protein, partial [Myxococcales bacterium]|nr:helix-turn-helix domain-containing protein [Myxococcales bacterium]